MTNLTEKWKKGELPEGEYWVKHNGVINQLDELEIALTDVEQILGKVPTFEQWQQLKEYERIVTSYNMKPIDYDLSCRVVTRLLDEKKRLKKENTKLKELLKECEHMIIAYSINNNTFTKEEIKNIISKIDQVLGEE